MVRPFLQNRSASLAGSGVEPNADNTSRDRLPSRRNTVLSLEKGRPPLPSI